MQTCDKCSNDITIKNTWLVSNLGTAMNMYEPTQVCQVDMSGLPKKQITHLCTKCVEARKI
jgi:hypothetical protein